MAKEVDESCIILEPGFKRISERGGVVDEDGVINLASAVVKQAIWDFKVTLKWLKAHPFDDSRQRREIEKLHKETQWFFRSRWFAHIVDCDGNKLIKTLRGAV